MSGDGFRARLAAPEGAAVVAFRLGGELYGCDVLLVQEVVHKHRVHPLPDMPARVLGVLRLREELVPVLDVAPLLDVRMEGGPRAVMITATEAGQVGVATDGVHEVLQVPGGAFRPAPLTGGSRESFILGVARVDGILLTLIDLSEMLREQTTLAAGEPL